MALPRSPTVYTNRAVGRINMVRITTNLQVKLQILRLAPMLFTSLTIGSIIASLGFAAGNPLAVRQEAAPFGLVSVEPSTVKLDQVRYLTYIPRLHCSNAFAGVHSALQLHNRLPPAEVLRRLSAMHSTKWLRPALHSSGS